MSGRFFVAAALSLVAGLLPGSGIAPVAGISIHQVHNQTSGKVHDVHDRGLELGSVGRSLRRSAGSGWRSRLQNTLPHFLQSSLTSDQVPLQPHALSCFPDMPGNFTTAGVGMLAGMLLVAGLIRWLLDQPKSSQTTRTALAPPPVPRPSRPTIRTLDGLRTVFITYIIIIHFPDGTPSPIVPLLADGWAMQFFSVLSGFVAFYVMEGKSDTLTWSTGAQWVGRRLARLAVLHQVALLADYARVAYIGGPCTANQCRPLLAWPMNAMFMQGLFPVRICGAPGDDATWNYLHFNANGVGWFTACLAWISVAFPFLYNNRPRSGIDSTCSLVGLVIFARCLSEVFCPDWAMWGGPGVLHPYAFVPLRLLEFWAGMLTAQAAGQCSEEFRRWKGWGWAFDGFLVSGFIGVALMVRTYHASALRTGEYYMIPMWCLVCMAAGFVAERHEADRGTWLSNGPLHGILEFGPVVSLAPYSYGVYQLHQVTLRWVFAIGGPMHYWIFPLNILISWMAGAFATKFIEAPLLSVVEERLKRIAKKEAAAQEAQKALREESPLTPAVPIFH